MMKEKARVKEGHPLSSPPTEKTSSSSETSESAHRDPRGLIDDNAQRLYDFCQYLLYGMLDMDELIVSVFRRFGAAFLKSRSRRGAEAKANDTLELFALAWDQVREIVTRNAFAWTAGRDTRPLKGASDDLLGWWEAHPGSWEKIDSPLMERLGSIDLDFRAPVVLRDILRFEDDEVIHILGLRWGVYRHRLHRGRLELRGALRGPGSATATS